MAMRQVEIQARSVDEAVRLALEQMGRTREQVDIQVLAGTQTGSEDDEVLVRVTAREQISGPRERERREAPAAPRDLPEVDGNRVVPARAATDTGNREAPRAGGYDRGPRPDRGGYDRGPRPDRGAGYDRGPRPDRGDRYDRGPRPDRAETYDQPYRGSEPAPPGEIEIDAALVPPANPDDANFASPADAVAPLAAEILQTLLVGMRFRGRIARHEPEAEADVNSGDTDPSVVLNITGLTDQDQQLLVGRRGENLTALQFMVNLLLGAKTDLWARVVVDVDGYRIKRREALTMLAERMAERVIEQGQPYPLEPMSPYDRRLVHMALSEHPRVMTESTGEGEDRRVVIMLRQ
ncbi:MAG TPA: R3H domain-containing nucleic acid-binding protein [Chloroflexia bacterium]|nr:R3H domain-containing nucleic acid-binding protein [Chloroflexia bacterium]